MFRAACLYTKRTNEYEQIESSGSKEHSRCAVAGGVARGSLCLSILLVNGVNDPFEALVEAGSVNSRASLDVPGAVRDL